MTMFVIVKYSGKQVRGFSKIALGMRLELLNGIWPINYPVSYLIF